MVAESATDIRAGAWKPTTTVLVGTRGLPGWDDHLPTIFDQTMPPDEILVVIDRETDDAERKEFAARWPQVRFVFNDVNLGITRTLNVGLSAATGEVIFRADDDDSYAPTRIERQIELMRETGADIVASWAEGTADGGALYLIKSPTDDAAIRAGLLTRNVLIHPSVGYRRERILALGGYNETFVNAQDYALYLAAMRAGYRFAAVAAPLVRRHYTADNITVRRRYHQVMYSCAARVLHHAASGDRRAFLATLAHYARLAAIPMWARKARRNVAALVGRGS